MVSIRRGDGTRSSAWLATSLALLALAVGVSSTAAQQPPLRSVASVVATSWSDGDAEGIARLLSPSGVALHLLGRSQLAAGVRQARAALSELFERSGPARVVRAEELGGSPQRGFAEIRWDVTEPGTPDAMRYVVFLGFVGDGDGWRIAEVRVLR